MAFQVKKIYPLDLKPSIAIGVDLPFSAAAVFNSTYETKDAIKANLVNYFLTNKGERFMNPEFGSNVRKLLFDNIDTETLDKLEGTIATELDQYFPRVVAREIKASSQPDQNSIRLYIRYSIEDTNIEDEILINFEQ